MYRVQYYQTSTGARGMCPLRVREGCRLVSGCLPHRVCNLQSNRLSVSCYFRQEYLCILDQAHWRTSGGTQSALKQLPFFMTHSFQWGSGTDGKTLTEKSWIFFVILSVCPWLLLAVIVSLLSGFCLYFSFGSSSASCMFFSIWHVSSQICFVCY